jgi:hypothetical protein
MYTFFAEFEIFVQSVFNAMHLTLLTHRCHQPEVTDVLRHKGMEIYDLTYAVCCRGRKLLSSVSNNILFLYYLHILYYTLPLYVNGYEVTSVIKQEYVLLKKKKLKTRKYGI